MFLLLAFVLVPLIGFLILELYFYQFKKTINRQFPGAPTLPLLGNAHQVGNTPSVILDKLFDWWREFGKSNFVIWIGYFTNIMITEPQDVEFLLTSNTLIQKSDAYDMLHPWLGMGLLTSSGTKWHKHRKMITPSFHFKILQHFHEVMNTNSTKFVEKLRAASAGETIFDFQDMVHYLTLDVICDTAMGVHINAMDNHDSEVVAAFKEICFNINMRSFHPIKRKEYLYKFASDYPAYKRTLNTLKDFTTDVIEKRMAALQSETENKDEQADGAEFQPRRKMAFLDTLLTSTIDNRPLTKQEIYEEVSTFMFEGHDTTTSGIAFAVYLLSRHPEIQRKVYAEQQAVLGSNLKRDATFQEIADMKYLELVLKESLRLYPSVPIIGRCAEKEYNMNGKILPKGSTMNLFIIAMGYNEKYFPDPYRCDPARFDVEKRDEKANPFAYVPFSAGPRNCIGQKFALLELKTIVSKVVRTFEILPPLDELVSTDGYVQHFFGLTETEKANLNCRKNPSKYDPIISAVLTLKSDNGIQLRMRERQ